MLGIQWPLCSQKKGTGNPCLGVIRARGQLGGPLPITLPLEPACLGLLGQGKDQGPQIGFLWFQTLCRVVLWLVKDTPGCVPFTILNNDGIKVARSGGTSAPTKFSLGSCSGLFPSLSSLCMLSLAHRAFPSLLGKV